jgi:Putative restriction endonuclease
MQPSVGPYNERMATQAGPSSRLHRFDAATYNEMVASGALEGEPVELLEGWLVDVMSPQSPGHAVVITRLTRHFRTAQAWLQVQLPLEIPPDSEPEPDLALLEDEPLPDRHPRAALLVVEVAVSSHAEDRGVKARLYAKAGVPTYWLVDVPGKAVEVRTAPGSDAYDRCDVYASDSPVPSPAPGVADLDVGALLEGIGS